MNLSKCPKCNEGYLCPVISPDRTSHEADMCDACGSTWAYNPPRPAPNPLPENAVIMNADWTIPRRAAVSDSTIDVARAVASMVAPPGMIATIRERVEEEQARKPTRVVSAAIIEVFEEGPRVLLAKRGPGSHEGKWCTPGGKAREGETDDVALRRELHEELGPDADIMPRIEPLYEHRGERTTANKPFVLVCYSARRHVAGAWYEAQPTEGIVEAKWTSADELATLALAPADDANRHILIGVLRELEGPSLGARTRRDTAREAAGERALAGVEGATSAVAPKDKMRVPPRPDFGTGPAGGSAYEARLQDDWDRVYGPLVRFGEAEVDETKSAGLLASIVARDDEESPKLPICTCATSIYGHGPAARTRTKPGCPMHDPGGATPKHTKDQADGDASAEFRTAIEPIQGRIDERLSQNPPCGDDGNAETAANPAREPTWKDIRVVVDPSMGPGEWKIGAEAPLDLAALRALAKEALEHISAPVLAGRRPLNREAYGKLVEEDIAWCKAQPQTLERDHVVSVLRWSTGALYAKERSDVHLLATAVEQLLARVRELEAGVARLDEQGRKMNAERDRAYRILEAAGASPDGGEEAGAAQIMRWFEERAEEVERLTRERDAARELVKAHANDAERFRRARDEAEASVERMKPVVEAATKRCLADGNSVEEAHAMNEMIEAYGVFVANGGGL